MKKQPLLDRLARQIGLVVRGKDEIIERALISLLARGHLLIQDVPGVGKTLLARTIATSLDLSFKRIQFTADMMPSDITGVSIYNPDEREFTFKPGPIFTNLLLADEINRASPKTQSALLEAMQEGFVTMDSASRPLPEPFFVIATQNPMEFSGTYMLPESQLDRFTLCTAMGYPAHDVEREILLLNPEEKILAGLDAVLNHGEVLTLQREADEVYVNDKIVHYLLAIVERTRNDPNLLLGASTRAAQHLLAAARARALLRGRDYCIPDDIKRLVIPAFSHRLALRQIQDSRNEQAGVELLLTSIIEEIDVPL